MTMEAVKEMVGYDRYRSYSPSEVPWLDEAPTGWSVRQLRHVCEMLVSTIDKHTHSNEIPVRLCNYVDVYKNVRITKDLEFMRATASAVEVSRFRIRKGDVIITKDSEDWKDIAVPALVDYEADDLVCGYHLALLRPSEAIAPAFLYYTLLADYARTHLSLKAKGFTRFGIAHGGIRSTPILLPPLPEQTRIAAFLDRKCGQIDAVIAQKERLIALLKERRQVLVQQAVTKGLDPQVEMKDSGVAWLGEVPEHWEFVPNRHIFQLMKRPVGKAHGDYTLLSLTLNGVIKRDMENPEGKFPAEFDTYQEVKPGEFVFCLFDVEETPRTVGLAKDHGMITGAYTVMANRSKALSEYLYYYYLSLDSQKALRSIYRGLRNTIPKDVFASIKTPIPPLEEQRAIVSKIEANEAKTSRSIKDLEASIAKLKEYRSILINAAVTGKIKVPEE